MPARVRGALPLSPWRRRGPSRRWRRQQPRQEASRSGRAARKDRGTRFDLGSLPPASTSSWGQRRSSRPSTPLDAVRVGVVWCFGADYWAACVTRFGVRARNGEPDPVGRGSHGATARLPVHLRRRRHGVSALGWVPACPPLPRARSSPARDRGGCAPLAAAASSDAPLGPCGSRPLLLRRPEA